MTDILRVYLDPDEIDAETGYPWQWKYGMRDIARTSEAERVRIPDLVREQAGHRCIRCGHPFVVGNTPGRWSPCDVLCTHGAPVRLSEPGAGYHDATDLYLREQTDHGYAGEMVEVAQRERRRPEPVVCAEWRVLTVHHLNGIKHDCRWWNLVSLCQRCHLLIQAKVHMQRRYLRQHSEWFKPYVAAFYAWDRLGQDLTREETMARLDELLALEDTQMEIE